jgi:hypothetical protein
VVELREAMILEAIEPSGDKGKIQFLGLLAPGA